MAKSNGHNVETRLRLLEAAGEVFAEAGFRAATVRDICVRAGANIAAVNYHFGDKERLYLEALRHASACSSVTDKNSTAMDESAPPRRRLAGFVRSFLEEILDGDRPAWRGKLISREIAEPTDALDLIVDNHIRPRAMLIEAIVAELLPRGSSRSDARQCAMSVVAQILFYFHSRAVITRLHPGMRCDKDDIDALAGHITRFSLAALKNWKKGAAK